MAQELYKYHANDMKDMLEDDMNNSTEYVAACKYMIHLMKCALNNLPAQPKPEECSWKVLYKCISSNNVKGLTFYAIEPFAEEMPQSLIKVWEDYKDAIVFKQLMMTEEREAIINDLSKYGMSFLMLKGNNIEKYYPMPGMREMTDNDILYGVITKDDRGEYHIVGNTEDEQKTTIAEAQKKLISYMEDRGYTTDGFYTKDDVCIKGELYNFEMHRALMDSDSPHLEYYKNPWKWAIKNDNSDYEYHYSIEDEYIFMLAHEFKHYSTRGCGVRFLADIYMFIKSENDNMNWDYINQEFAKLELVEFEQHMKKLAFDTFEPGKSTDEAEDEELLYMCKCGTFGVFKTLLHHRVKDFAKDGEDLKKAKRRYFFTRFFPPDEFYKKEFPFFYNHKLLRPLLTIYRCFKGLFLHFSDLKKEIKEVLGMK